jgi:amino acid adenylation domain-containing protein/thioester reductase-like protein
MSELPQDLRELSAEDKRALLVRLLEEKRNREESTFPLSHGQKALWFFHQFVRGTSAYNVASAMRIRGRLNLAVLPAAIQVLVDRHPCLRTVFALSPSGEPFQQVVEKGSFTYREIDAAAWPWERLYSCLVDEAHCPFDLERGPLFRVNVYVQSPENYVVLMVMNHIVVDFWSMGVLMQEFLAIYKAKNDGAEPALPVLQANYKDYIEWEKSMLAGQEGEKLFSYWQEQLHGELPVLKLLSNRRRPPSLADRGAVFVSKVDKQIARQLQALAAVEGTTLYTVLLAVFQVLLYRYTGQGDILVGSPVAGRTLAELENVVGFFVNTIVLRASLNEELHFNTFLRQIRGKVLGAFAHQDYPLPLLVERLQPSRYGSYSPLFQVMFNLVQPRHLERSGAARILLGNAHGKIQFSGLEVEALSLEQRAAHFDLTLTVIDVEASITAQWQYNAGFLCAESVARMAEHFNMLLGGIVSDPGRRIAQLPLLTTEDRRLLVEWNNTEKEFPSHLCFHELFAAQAARTPDHIAISTQTEAMSYQELNTRASHLAGKLPQRQFGPQAVLAVLARRGCNLLTAMLAIFKTGNIYLPIDPAYPAARVRYMLEQSRAMLLLAERNQTAVIAEILSGIALEKRPAVMVIEDLSEGTRSPENHVSTCKPEDLAYVIFTSGSTGLPKGAMIEHQGMLNHLFAKISDLGLTSTDIVAQTASQCFDISMWQYLAPLLIGGQTHIIDQETAGNPYRLLRCVDDSKVSILESVPSLIAEMIYELGTREMSRPQLKSLRWFLATGEDLQPELCRRWFHYYPGTPLFNAYGPTECSDDVTHHPILEPPDPDAIYVPIGRPIANMQTYVLDKCLEPVPIGLPGELYVGGVGVGRGYIHEPDRTALAFVPDPFSQIPDRRMYKTGDLVRMRHDGLLEFLGRLDSQVKLHGQRIELHEIESVLARHGNVREVVVVSEKKSADAVRLVAYIVAKEKPTPPIYELRSALKDQLPHYMVPSAFIFLDALPRSANGKLDRDALPAADGVRPELEAAFVPPRNETEKGLAELWARLLKLERVGVFDNFFELGGHSMLAIQLLSRLRGTYSRDIAARRFFENPTVAALAQLISSPFEAGEDEPYLATNMEELRVDVTLDPDIIPRVSAIPTAQESILLTGATGFLGSYLLLELLRQTQAKIYCLVRATSPQNGMEKIRRQLESYGLAHQELADRVHVVVGDLAKLLFGHSQDEFSALAGQIGVIYHNAAWVSSVLPYPALRATNVLGTQEVLRLACLGNAKPVHYVSTLAVCSLLGDSGNAVREDDDISQVQQLFGGYAQSKWVAEGLVHLARARGLPVTVYRPGIITAHSKTGVANSEDLFSALLKGCIQLGAAPIMHAAIEMTPVDYVCEAMIRISRQPDSCGKVFHLLNPSAITCEQLVHWVDALGYPLQQITFDEWISKLEALGADLRNNALYPFISLFPVLDIEMQKYLGVTLSEMRLPRYDCSNTVKALQSSSLKCPAVDKNMLGRYLSRLAENYVLQPTTNGGPSEEGPQSKSRTANAG